MNKRLKYLFYWLLWTAVVALLVFAGIRTVHLRRALRVTALEIELKDSTADGYLVTGKQVRGWLEKAKIPIIGEAVEQLPLTGIKQLIAENGFVGETTVYTTGQGVLRIEIGQRTPLLRLLSGGCDSYVTREGVVFRAPRSTSVYVAVVTGDYKPPFPPKFSGHTAWWLEHSLERLDSLNQALEWNKRPYFEMSQAYSDSMRLERRRFIRQKWWILETEKEFEKRVVKLRAEKKQNRRRFRYIKRLYQDSIGMVARKQDQNRLEQKKLAKNYEDFMKLLTFVDEVEKDKFWRSEIVQIVARSTPSGSLELDLIPRSGRFKIRFGRLEYVAEKFEKLNEFYRHGLPQIGWDKYRMIDVRFSDQVVCK